MEYTKEIKENIIELLNKAKDNGTIIINGTVDSILGHLDFDKSELEVNESLFDIKHSSFLNLFIKNKDVFKELFNCNNMSQLTKNIIDISKDWELYGYKEEDGSDKLKGDLFEIFAEVFFKLTSSDSRVGITDYTPGASTDDYGVDGYGIAMNSLPCTVQVKFRSNVTTKLTIKDLKNFQGLSYRKYKVPVDATQNLIVFTNCSGVHWNTETKVMENSVVTFCSFNGESNHSLNNLIDDNFSFWKNVEKIINHNTSKYLS
jgi:hypothetical protein